MDKVLFSFFFLILVPFNFIDADERNANVDRRTRRTRIIHKLTASCLQLSFHLTLKFLVLLTIRQFFRFCCFYILNVKQQFKVDTPMQIFHPEVRRSYHLFFLFFSYIKCKTTTQSGRSNADFSTKS